MTEIMTESGSEPKLRNQIERTEFEIKAAPAVCLSDAIDTDLIIAGRYLRTKDIQIWAEHAFEDLDPKLHTRLHGSVIVAGKNFGCGSSREQAAVAIQAAGVQAVIAASFARIFFRNALNIALPLFEVPDIVCTDDDLIDCSLATGMVTVRDKAGRVKVFYARPLSARMKDIIQNGGLAPYIKERMEKRMVTRSR